MRPEGRQELQSLYFDYPQFEAPRRQASTASETPVVIIGAGPVGLAAALTLARFGVPCVVLERKSTFNDGSRAICISRSSFQLFDRLGVATPFVDKALGWTTGRSFYRGLQFLEFQMPHDGHEKYLPMYNLQQQYIEKFLYDAAATTGLVDMRWRSEAAALRDDGEGVTVEVQDPAGRYQLKAQWALVADGARSAVRAMRGLKLKGENLEGRYVIVDVRMRHDYPTIRRALFDPQCNPGGTVLIHRQPDDIWRIDYQLGAEESAEEAIKESVVRPKIAAILEEIGHKGSWDLEWWSTYTANTLALDDYRDGRVFFIGDSAHVVPIFGVRGLNNGLADAENAAWKIARVVKGASGPALLESYTPERRGATLDVFRNAVKSTRFMTPPTRGWSLMRDAALSLAREHAFAAAFANPRQMTPYDYAMSPLTAKDDSSFDSGPAPGAVAPEVKLSAEFYLSDLLGSGFTGLIFADERKAADFSARFNELDPSFTAVAIDGDRIVVGGRIFERGHAAMARFGATPGDFYLIRPDRYVAGRWRGAMADEAVTFFARAFGGREV